MGQSDGVVDGFVPNQPWPTTERFFIDQPSAGPPERPSASPGSWWAATRCLVFSTVVRHERLNGRSRQYHDRRSGPPYIDAGL